MGETEERTLKTGWSPRLKSAAQHKADHDAEERRQQALDMLTMRMRSTPDAPGKSKKRKHKPETAALYARIREIPKDVSLRDFCRTFDNVQRTTFHLPKDWRDQGCPDSWTKAWQNGKWRKRIHDLRQNAWRDVPKKPPHKAV